MFINPERKISSSSKQELRKCNGLKNMKRIKLKLPLLNKMLNLKLELPRKLPIERIIKWIF
jgi:hypothetical protein